MSKQNLRINISTDDVERAVDEAVGDIDDSLDAAARELREVGLDAAKDHIRKHDRVWNKEVLNNWVPTQTKSLIGNVRMYGWNNYSDHANVVDEGATYTDKKPPLEDMLQYVQSPKTSFIPTEDMSQRDWAFWLQNKIFEEGITGIGYKKIATNKMEAEANKAISKQMKRNSNE